MPRLPDPEPVEERVARRVAPRVGAGPVRTRVSWWLRRLGDYDRVVYRSVAGLSTPLVDEPLRRVSNFANHSKPWIFVSGLLALFGGGRGRRVAVTGLATVALTSLVVNQPMKSGMARRRPDRGVLGVPERRWVRMPTSGSFPSGHSASAAAFAVAVGDVTPPLRTPLRVAASVVAFSRVYTGAHYPSDVLVGAAVGAVIGRVSARVARRFLLPSPTRR